MIYTYMTKKLDNVSVFHKYIYSHHASVSVKNWCVSVNDLFHLHYKTIIYTYMHNIGTN